MNAHEPNVPGAPRPWYTDLVDLASERVGAKALATNDDFFAPKENLLKASAPVFIPDKYTENGKWMDGWESRRKRLTDAERENPDLARDWCVVELGAPGVIRGVNVDTSFFTGNYPEFCSLEACEAGEGTLDRAVWKAVVPKSRLSGGTQNYFAVESAGRFTHVRLNIFPDGGVARLHVHGEVRPDWKRLRAMAPIDLAAVENGGTVVTCNDMFFGFKDNLIMPGRAATMGDGWETRRRRGPGFDWIIVRLGARGRIQKIEVDTNHFKGNFPESCSIVACDAGEREISAEELRNAGDPVWHEVLPRTKLQAHTRHFFEKELRATAGAVSHVRLNIFPDGGVSRLRVHGDPAGETSE